MTVTTRDVWMTAKRRLIERYLVQHPGTAWDKAAAVISDRHEAIGAEMSAINGKRPFRRERTGA